MKSLTNYAVITATCFTAASCTTDPQTDNSFTATEETPFITPALAGIDVPFQQFEINAGEGDTIYYNSGSVIVFPPHSLMDKNGVIVSGKVDISYREFADPVDFFLSGIPMNYDSGGTNYTFESAAMCEIYATQNNEPLFVNPLQRPEVNLASADKDLAHNLYYLDTVAQRWVYQGKDIMTDVQAIPVIQELPDEEITELIPPQKPEKADETKSSFIIIIEPGSVKELSVYNNMKFEVDEDEEGYNPKSDTEYWDDVKVENTKKKGTFLVTFTSKHRQVSYLGRPVYEGKDYMEALKEFEIKQKEYDQLLSKRLSKEKKERDQIEKENKIARAEKDRIDRINKFIEIKNKKTAERERLFAQTALEMEGKRKDVLKRKAIEQAELKRLFEIAEKERETKAFVNGGAEMSNQVFRTFTLEGFGAWNIDKPELIPAITIVANYVDEQGIKLPVKNVNIVYEGFNGISSFWTESISVLPNTGNMILGVIGNKLAYMRAEDFLKCNIDSTTEEYTFTMNIHPGEITSNEDIRRIVGL